MSEWPGGFEIKQLGKNTWDFEVRKEISKEFELHYDMASEPDTGSKTWKGTLEGFDGGAKPHERKPHYKAKRVNGSFTLNPSNPNRDYGKFKLIHNKYHWLTSNGNIYEYTLKQ